jgi:Skp family chaperone for outer membrane proteins
MIRCFALLMLAAAAMGGGCASTGIAIREQLGFPKREQLVSRVQDARDEQEKAKTQFATTLDEFQALTGFEGGDLEALYLRLQREQERSEARAADVSKRIRDVERVAEALFKEWEKELDEYQSTELRRASEDQLERTRDRYDQLLAAMQRVEASMEPVLAAFADQVLFLKHNLNARAIASLEGTVAGLTDEVAQLIDQMEASIAEANIFIEELQS